MSAPKFTQGRWYAKQGVSQMVSDDTTVVSVNRANGELAHWFVFADTEHHGDAEADAHLIAAAPELYEALERICEAHRRETPLRAAAMENAYRLAREALAKAVP